MTWPAEGQPITIGPSDYIMLDVSPPKIGLLTISGRLEFVSADLVLKADSILVFGSLVVGTPQSPFTKKAEIVLYGDRNSDNVVVDNVNFLGNKALVVFGNVSLVGKPHVSHWTKLASTAAAGSTTITLTQPVLASGSSLGWAVGDSIVLGETEYSSWSETASQVEKAVIAAISGDGKTLALAAPLKYSHYAGRLSASASSPVYSVQVSAAVGLLSKNVVVRGDMPSANGANMGAHVLVRSITLGGVAGQTTYRGSLTCTNVELRDMGQEGLDWAAIDVRFGPKDAGKLPPVNVSSVMVHRSYHSGIVVKGYPGFALTNSVLYATKKNGLYLDKDSSSPVINGNLFAGNYLSSATYCCGVELGTLVIGQAAVNIGTPPLSLRGNVATGMFDNGFVVPGDDCSAPVPSTFDNEAVGVVVGFVITQRPGSTCTQASGMTVWKASHVGIMPSSIVGSVWVANSLVSDSHTGLFTFSSHGGTSAASITYKNVTVVGTSPATASCSASTLCRTTASKERGQNCSSAYGSSARRIGVLVPLVQNDRHVKTSESYETWAFRTDWFGCAPRWDERYGLSNGPFIDFRLEGVTFSGFTETECSSMHSRAMAYHPEDTDASLFIQASGVTWDSTPTKARVLLPEGHRPVIKDLDGTFIGQAPGTMLLGRNASNVAEPGCSALASYNSGLLCPLSMATLRTIMLTSIDMVQGSDANVMGPVTVKRYSATYGDRSEVYAVDQKMGCSLAGFFKQPNVNFVILPGTTTRIQGSSTEAVQTRLSLNSPSASDKVVVEYFLTRPNSQAVFLDGVRVDTINDKYLDTPAASLPLPKLTDPVGTALQRSDLKVIYLVLGGGYRYVDIVRQPSVMLSMTVSGPPGAAINTGPIVTSLASLLGISPSRIKVVNVAPLSRRLAGNATAGNSTSGAQTLSIEILDDKPVVAAATTSPAATDPTTDATSASAVTATVNATLTNLAAFDQQSRMAALGAQLAVMASSGALVQTLATSANLTVAAIAVAAPSVAVAQPNISAVADLVAASGMNVSLPSASPTPTATPTASAGATGTASSKATVSAVSLVTASASASGTASSRPTVSAASSASATASTSATQSDTPTATSTGTATATFGSSASAVSSSTATGSARPTTSAAATSTAVASASSVSTASATSPVTSSASASSAALPALALALTVEGVDASTLVSDSGRASLAAAVAVAAGAPANRVTVTRVVDTATNTVLYSAGRRLQSSSGRYTVSFAIRYPTMTALDTAANSISGSGDTFGASVLTALLASGGAGLGGASLAGFTLWGSSNVPPFTSTTVIRPGTAASSSSPATPVGAVVGGVVAGLVVVGAAMYVVRRRAQASQAAIHAHAHGLVAMHGSGEAGKSISHHGDKHAEVVVAPAKPMFVAAHSAPESPARSLDKGLSFRQSVMKSIRHMVFEPQPTAPASPSQVEVASEDDTDKDKDGDSSSSQSHSRSASKSSKKRLYDNFRAAHHDIVEEHAQGSANASAGAGTGAEDVTTIQVVRREVPKHSSPRK